MSNYMLWVRRAVGVLTQIDALRDQVRGLLDEHAHDADDEVTGASELRELARAASADRDAVAALASRADRIAEVVARHAERLDALERVTGRAVDLAELGNLAAAERRLAQLAKPSAIRCNAFGAFADAPGGGDYACTLPHGHPDTDGEGGHRAT